MKKLFFAAALAIVAVGASLSSKALDAYQAGSSSPITCNTGSTLCTSIQPLYKVASPQDATTQYTNTELGSTRYN